MEASERRPRAAQRGKTLQNIQRHDWYVKVYTCAGFANSRETIGRFWLWILSVKI